jgi:hypothetical protein
MLAQAKRTADRDTVSRVRNSGSGDPALHALGIHPDHLRELVRSETGASQRILEVLVRHPWPVSFVPTKVGLCRVFAVYPVKLSVDVQGRLPRRP